MDLFVRLIVINFSVYLITYLLEPENQAKIFVQTISSSDYFIVNLFLVRYTVLVLIIATLIFAKNAPKFFKQMLGIKDNGGKFFSAFGSALGLGKGVLATGVGIASGVATGWRGSEASQRARYIEEHGNDVGFKANRGSQFAAALLRGGLSGGAAGSAVYSDKNHKLTSGLKASHKSNSAYAQYAEDGADLFGKAASFGQRVFTGETEAERTERALKGYEKQRKAADALVSYADKKAQTTDWTSGSVVDKILHDKNGNQYTKSVSGNYQAWTFAKKAAEDQNASSFKFNGTVYTLEEANALDFDFMKANSTDYIQKLGVNPNNGDRDMEFEKLAAEFTSTNGPKITNTTTRKNIKDAIADIDRKIMDSQKGYTRQKANSDATKPQ